MKNLYVFLILICLYSCNKKEEVIINYNDITIVDDIAYYKYDMSLVTGLVKKLNHDLVKYEGAFISGKKEGVHKSWFHGEDEIQYINCWKNGKRDSVSKQYYLNGQLWTEGFYENDVKDGSFKTWSIGGRLKSVEFYKNGVRDSIWKKWNEKGELESEIIYEAGELISQNYY